jgi:hypothetical protein
MNQNAAGLVKRSTARHSQKKNDCGERDQKSDQRGRRAPGHRPARAGKKRKEESLNGGSGVHTDATKNRKSGRSQGVVDHMIQHQDDGGVA